MSQPISAYSQLQSLVATQQLQIIELIAPPRSYGTAFSQALTQPKEVHSQLNEPSFYPDLKGRKWDYQPSATEPAARTFEDVCGHILKRYTEVQKELSEAGKKEKVVLVIHDLSPDLTLGEFNEIRKIASHTIFAVRNVAQQALSLLTRYVNDQISKPGGDLISTAEVVGLMKSPADFKAFMKANPAKVSGELIWKLTEGTVKEQYIDATDPKQIAEAEALFESRVDDVVTKARRKVLDIFTHEFTIPWENIHRFHAEISATKEAYTVFRGEHLFDHPKEHLEALCKRIGLTYTDQMLKGWTKATGNDFHCVITANWGEFAKTNAWNGPARNSTGLGIQKGGIDKAVPMESFPVEVRELIGQYEKLYSEIVAKKA